MTEENATAPPSVISVSRDGEHRFSKTPVDVITLVAGIGVEGDAHAGEEVQHLSRVARNPTQPNLRQVHLMHSELFDELRERGFDVGPSQLGENITTSGVDLLNLPRGTTLRIGAAAEIEITGLRNPCSQINDFSPGLMQEVVHRDADGTLVRKTGVMGIVVSGGPVGRGDSISVDLPGGTHEPLGPV